MANTILLSGRSLKNVFQRTSTVTFELYCENYLFEFKTLTVSILHNILRIIYGRSHIATVRLGTLLVSNEILDRRTWSLIENEKNSYGPTNHESFYSFFYLCRNNIFLVMHYSLYWFYNLQTRQGCPRPLPRAQHFRSMANRHRAFIKNWKVITSNTS